MWKMLYDFRQWLYSHERNHIVINTVCKHCGNVSTLLKMFYWISNLEVHIKNMHLITGGFDCEVCTLYLPSKEVLESHKSFFLFWEMENKQQHLETHWRNKICTLVAAFRNNYVLYNFSTERKHRDTLCRIAVW